jgi:hypothetical protein
MIDCIEINRIAKEHREKSLDFKIGDRVFTSAIEDCLSESSGEIISISMTYTPPISVLMDWGDICLFWADEIKLDPQNRMF